MARMAVATVIAVPAIAVIAQGCGDTQKPVAQAPPPQPAAVGKKPAAVNKPPKPKPASADGRQRLASGELIIPLTIRNDTASPVTLHVIKTDNYDWTSPRPDHPSSEGGFQGTTLKPQEEDTRNLGTNLSADVYFEIEFLLDNAPDPPVVRLQEKSGCCFAGDIFNGWGSSDTNDETCRAVTKSFPAHKVQVTMQCELPGDNSLVKIEAL